MPFGAATSCSHFQRFSNAVAHIVKCLTKHNNVNYLDDFFFAAVLKYLCNQQVHTFLQVCQEICFPVSMEKTFWATTRLSFLGLVLDTSHQLICVPIEKITKGIELIKHVKSKKKIKLKLLQKLTGFLNFLCKAVSPGRAFTRRLYSYGANLTNKHHHLNVTLEMKADLDTWLLFLEHPSVFCRKFLDLSAKTYTHTLNWFTDASANHKLGAGGISDSNWYILQWDSNFIEKFNPSINYLELYALTIAIFNWIHKYSNMNVVLFCDNQSVVYMVNSSSSRCKNCMILIRMIVLKCLTHNVKITLKYVRSEDNTFADLLSRMKYKEFRKLARRNNVKFDKEPANIPEELWPMDKLFI